MYLCELFPPLLDFFLSHQQLALGFRPSCLFDLSFLSHLPSIHTVQLLCQEEDLSLTLPPLNLKLILALLLHVNSRLFQQALRHLLMLDNLLDFPLLLLINELGRVQLLREMLCIFLVIMQVQFELIFFP